ncbi:hypothetical protein F5887DRAFT_920023 [Amanita rubescens]|nr:hypothetical protein F5887DRAFT_920023 [Amanita rubescens]
MVSKAQGKGKKPESDDSDSDKYYGSDDLSDALLCSINLSDGACRGCQVQQSSSSTTLAETMQQTRPLEMNTPPQARMFVTSTPKRSPIEFTSRATPQLRASTSAAGNQVPAMTPHGMGSFTNSPRVSSSSMWTPSSSSSVLTVQTYSFAGSSGTPSSSSGMLPSSSASATSGQRLPSIPVVNPRKWFVVLYGRQMGIFHNWLTTERHISGFSHANFQKVAGSHSDAVTC